MVDQYRLYWEDILILLRYTSNNNRDSWCKYILVGIYESNIHETPLALENSYNSQPVCLSSISHATHNSFPLPPLIFESRLAVNAATPFSSWPNASHPFHSTSLLYSLPCFISLPLPSFPPPHTTLTHPWAQDTASCRSRSGACPWAGCLLARICCLLAPGSVSRRGRSPPAGKEKKTFNRKVRGNVFKRNVQRRASGKIAWW